MHGADCVCPAGMLSERDTEDTYVEERQLVEELEMEWIVGATCSEHANDRVLPLLKAVICRRHRVALSTISVLAGGYSFCHCQSGLDKVKN